MSDFAQSGLISTLQQLNEEHVSALERELAGLAAERPMALILPCHGADLAQSAFSHIVRELAGATFLSEILVSVNAAGGAALAAAHQSCAELPQRVRFLENAVGGKGENVRAALQVLREEKRVEIIALQDCDVTSFRRGNLVRLCFACAHPALGYAFAKMYYSRATDRLYGRVSRLFFAPLLHAIVRVAGHHPLVDFLLSFRYPLAGEAAFTRAVAEQITLAPGWALETGMLCEAFRLLDPRRICQVDGGSGYDHKHQPAATALAAMAAEIARTLFAQLATEGLALSAIVLADAYRREAASAVRRSAHLALINGLSFDEAAESEITDTFARVLEAR